MEIGQGKSQQDIHSSYAQPHRQETSKSYSKETSASSSYSRSSSSTNRNSSSNRHRRLLKNNSLFNDFNDFNDPFFDRFYDDDFYFDRLDDDFSLRSPLSCRNNSKFNFSNDGSFFSRTIPVIKRSSSTSSTGRTRTVPVEFVQSSKNKRQNGSSSVWSGKNSFDNSKGRTIPVSVLRSSDFTSPSYIPERKGRCC
ncbi:unnamed protein product [Didymodactylos carnosus]|uniref:Uncharacterized protein n=1 Tax=Didymodactylos carnosus TaxID=1234261 RepID=A0A813QPA9_9BILA|nr:unnamed protein product [Didymodactylos carnosus]CAF0785800.1 unnamed protein product [Didymodactylos carnosus]CAF3552910.1 unnamed protein product [Didymodactylos carnosus]CAF3567951.1 unnamed protein product [Didymodactylos carnosus]